MRRSALVLLVLSACGSSSPSGEGTDGGHVWPPSKGMDAKAPSHPDATRDASDAPTSTESGPVPEASPADTGQEAAPDASNYASASMWLCGANATHDYCKDPQEVTAILPDGSQTTTTPSPAPNPTLDCFYIYPSVDITSPPGNETNFDNLPDILDPIHSQAAPFSQVCRVYAPLYHQATYQGYFSADADVYLEKAYSDVAAAFQEYWSVYNDGRPFVLLGHSQGAQMLRRLVQRVVETTPPVQGQMALAVLAGELGDLYVPSGQLVGGSFQSTPLCTSPGERGCVISYNTFAEGYAPTSSYPDFAIPAGMDAACTNPGDVANGTSIAMLANTWFYTKFDNALLSPPQNTGVSTPFASYASFFSGQCVKSAQGYSYFQINPAPANGDTRTNPIPFGSLLYSPSILGLHLLDYAFPMGDLLAAVQARAAVDGGAGVADAGTDAGAKDATVD